MHIVSVSHFFFLHDPHLFFSHDLNRSLLKLQLFTEFHAFIPFFTFKNGKPINVPLGEDAVVRHKHCDAA